MKIYIAAKYERRFLLRSVRTLLEAQGHTITSQWLDNAEESKSREAGALMDVDDVMRAEACVFLGEPKGSANRGGGRWFEFGLAYALGRRCIAVLYTGGHESVFTALPTVETVETIEELLLLLSKEEQPRERQVIGSGDVGVLDDIFVPGADLSAITGGA